MSDSETLVLELEPVSLAKEVRCLPREALWVLRLFDGERVLADVVEESPLDVSKTLAVVQRGAELGYLRLGEKGSEKFEVRSLGPASKRWLEGSPEEKGNPTLLDKEGKRLGGESELEDELDEALARLGDSSLADPQDQPTNLTGLPEALERSLKQALDRYLGPQDIEVEKKPPVSFGELDRCLEEALQKPLDGFVASQDIDEDTGFSEVEEAFFDSYELDEEDDAGQLWVLGDELENTTSSTP